MQDIDFTVSRDIHGINNAILVYDLITRSWSSMTRAMSCLSATSSSFASVGRSGCSSRQLRVHFYV